MRIVGRKEFLALPKGTVYYPYAEGLGAGSLCVKEETVKHGNDWYYSELASIECSGSDEYGDILCKAEEDSSFNFPCDPSTAQRDGMFEESDRFVVLDADDVQKIILRLQEALSELASGGAMSEIMS